MRKIIGLKAFVGWSATVLLATGIAYAQSAPQTSSPTETVGNNTSGTGGEAQAASSNTGNKPPTPARPRVRRGSNFFGLPILGPLLGAAGAGAAVAATSGGSGAQPASPQ